MKFDGEQVLYFHQYFDNIFTCLTSNKRFSSMLGDWECTKNWSEIKDCIIKSRDNIKKLQKIQYWILEKNYPLKASKITSKDLISSILKEIHNATISNNDIYQFPELSISKRLICQCPACSCFLLKGGYTLDGKVDSFKDFRYTCPSHITSEWIKTRRPIDFGFHPESIIMTLGKINNIEIFQNCSMDLTLVSENFISFYKMFAVSLKKNLNTNVYALRSGSDWEIFENFNQITTVQSLSTVLKDYTPIVFYFKKSKNNEKLNYRLYESISINKLYLKKYADDMEAYDSGIHFFKGFRRYCKKALKSLVQYDSKGLIDNGQKAVKINFYKQIVCVSLKDKETEKLSFYILCNQLFKFPNETLYRVCSVILDHQGDFYCIFYEKLTSIWILIENSNIKCRYSTLENFLSNNTDYIPKFLILNQESTESELYNPNESPSKVSLNCFYSTLSDFLCNNIYSLSELVPNQKSAKIDLLDSCEPIRSFKVIDEEDTIKIEKDEDEDMRMKNLVLNLFNTFDENNPCNKVIISDSAFDDNQMWTQFREIICKKKTESGSIISNSEDIKKNSVDIYDGPLLLSGFKFDIIIKSLLKIIFSIADKIPLCKKDKKHHLFNNFYSKLDSSEPLECCYIINNQEQINRIKFNEILFEVSSFKEYFVFFLEIPIKQTLIDFCSSFWTINYNLNKNLFFCALRGILIFLNKEKKFFFLEFQTEKKFKEEINLLYPLDSEKFFIDNLPVLLVYVSDPSRTYLFMNYQDDSLCYINSTIQGIFNLKSFTKHFLSWENPFKWAKELKKIQKNNKLLATEKNKYYLKKFREYYSEETDFFRQKNLNDYENVEKFILNLFKTIHKYCTQENVCPVCRSFCIKGKKTYANKTKVIRSQTFFIEQMLPQKISKLDGDSICIYENEMVSYDIQEPPPVLWIQLKLMLSLDKKFDITLKKQAKNYLLNNETITYKRSDGKDFFYKTSSIILHGALHYKNILYSQSKNLWRCMNDSIKEKEIDSLHEYNFELFTPTSIFYTLETPVSIKNNNKLC